MQDSSNFCSGYIVIGTLIACLIILVSKNRLTVLQLFTEADKGQSQNIYEIRKKMFLKSEKIFQIVMFFGNRRKRVYQI